MTLLVGGVLAAGLLLVAAPWLWPAREKVEVAAPGRLDRMLAEAGFAHLRPRFVVAAGVLGAACAAALTWLVLGVPVLAAVAAVVVAAAPLGWLRHQRARRARSLRTLWPDVCDHLVAGVRSGLSLPDALASLAQSAPAALRPPFTAFARDLAASGHFDSSAQQLKHTLADPVADRIIETLRMARQVGGTELSTVLRALSASVRTQTALRGEVEARQSWIRGTAVLGVVAPWVIVALLSLRPEGARAFSSPDGIVLVLIGGAVSFAAYRLMLRIGRLPEPHRWFR